MRQVWKTPRVALMHGLLEITAILSRRCLRNLETRSSRSLAPPDLRVKRIFQLAASKRILVKSGHFGCDYSTSDQ